MKKALYIVLILSALQFTSAQQQNLKRANNYFERAFYGDAIALYEELLPRNKSKVLVQNLAESYYRTFKVGSASRWYSFLASRYPQSADENLYFKWSQALKAQGKYDEANSVLADYFAMQDQKEEAAQLKNDIRYLENVSAIGQRFTIENLGLNTVTSEFGAIVMDSVLLYTAARKKNDVPPKLYRWNNQRYLDIYVHPMEKIDQGDSLSVSLSKNINTKVHEGTFALSKDGNTIYFTRNNFNKGKKRTDSLKITNLKIYQAEKVEGKWENITALPFNGDNFSTEHPALSPDGKQLFFASDRPGGFGSFDLYSVTINEDGTFGEPKNLGTDINTSKKEQFPFISHTNELFFASDGHPGYGLLDVFVSKNRDGHFEKPDNIGLPVNSGYDDFSLTYNSDGKTGYFASNRPEGKGSDDIYAFVETKPLLIEDCKQTVTGILTDKITQQPLANGTVQLIGADGAVLKEVKTGKDASYRFSLACTSSYKIEGRKEEYASNSTNIFTNKERNKTHDASLALLSAQEMEKQRLLAEKKKKEEEAIRLKKEAEVKKQKEKATQLALNLERKKRVEAVIKKETAFVKKKERTIIKTKEIHFDYGMWYLRRETRERLGELIDLMQKYPNITVEIGSHTDIRGDATYNKQLSQRRADAARDYIIEKGIEADRVVAVGYGESQPIVECASESACTEEDHEWNRRCEFVVVKWD